MWLACEKDPERKLAMKIGGECHTSEWTVNTLLHHHFRTGISQFILEYMYQLCLWLIDDYLLLLFIFYDLFYYYFICWSAFTSYYYVESSIFLCSIWFNDKWLRWCVCVSCVSLCMMYVDFYQTIQQQNSHDYYVMWVLCVCVCCGCVSRCMCLNMIW